MAIRSSRERAVASVVSDDPVGDWEVLLHDHAWRPIGGDDTVTSSAVPEYWCDLCGMIWPLEDAGSGQIPEQVTRTCEVLTPRPHKQGQAAV